ncbi:MerR family transcriptional regulator [Cyanobium sp. Morenito 9A2]|uniref:MerR family transcriptional regulator n=1 Tax=Cyanobium sp. Morenito 9A2 TaxID=2823718 RepID=UPI0020CE8403|nr:MerR family transcriptional regulator [Cyanobium sp. Morenito 9A2]MCP9850771.1 MerR family transcriptional regulator [Cyanobium sp. Morenito 9A2]
MVKPPADSLPPQSFETFYGLEDLLELASEQLGEEITARTVRLYATQGLIDRPGKEGRSAVYGQRHLLQLLLIRSLARRGLSLSAIAPLCVLADDEIADQLAQLEGSTDPPATPTPSGEPGNEALAYLQGLERESSPSRLEGSGSLPLSLLGSPLPSPSFSRSPSSSSTRSTSRSTSRSGGSRDAASRWHRFSLFPGIELHISDSVSIPPPGSRRLSWLQKLGERLNDLLDGSQS